MFLVSSCSCLCPILWSQLSREWRCSSLQSVTYIRDLRIFFGFFMKQATFIWFQICNSSYNLPKFSLSPILSGMRFFRFLSDFRYLAIQWQNTWHLVKTWPLSLNFSYFLTIDKILDNFGHGNPPAYFMLFWYRKFLSFLFSCSSVRVRTAKVTAPVYVKPCVTVVHAWCRARGHCCRAPHW